MYAEPRRSLLVSWARLLWFPQSALYQPVRSVGLVPKARGSSDP